ncbi:ribonuclease H-like domain-containing protein [Tanacetum coccineum]
MPRPTNANIVRCMWLFRHKYLADGTLSRYKACLVANGNTQVEDIDVDETFIPVVKPEISLWAEASLSGLVLAESKLEDDGDLISDPTLYRSLAEAEYRGVANDVAETCWLRNLLRELHTPLSFATLTDLVAAGQVRVLHVPSRYQYADIFTKGLPSALFEEFHVSLSVRCSPTQTVMEC